MPQFDLSSFIVQLIWLFISFLSFYFIFSWNYLPTWGFLLKIRKKLELPYKSPDLKLEKYGLNTVKILSLLIGHTKNTVYSKKVEEIL